MNADEELHHLRNQVDDCNLRLLALLQERAALVAAIGRCKAAAGMATLDAAREAQMVADLAARMPQGPMPSAAVLRIFGAVLQESRELVQRVASEQRPPPGSD